jgi:hypothetical protein
MAVKGPTVKSMQEWHSQFHVTPPKGRVFHNGLQGFAFLLTQYVLVGAKSLRNNNDIEISA